MPTEPRRILIIQGHPDPRPIHFGHELAHAYLEGARRAGYDVNEIDVARLDFPLLRSGDELRSEAVPPAIREAQEAISRADHLVLIYPVWNGAMPALVKGFLEQIFRPRFMFSGSRPPTGFFSALWHKKALKGKTARVVVTMAMPGLVYRWFFHPHPEKTALRLSGVRPIRETFVGMIEGRNNTRRARWLGRMYALGLAGR